MNKSTFANSRIPRFTRAMVLAHMVSTCAIHAMDKVESPREPSPYDRVIRRFCDQHEFTAAHLGLGIDKSQDATKTVPIFDINKSAAKIHRNNLQALGQLPPSLLPTGSGSSEGISATPSSWTFKSAASAAANGIGNIFYSPVTFYHYMRTPKPVLATPTPTTPVTEGAVVADKSSKDGSSSTESKEDKSPVTPKEAAKTTVLPIELVTSQDSTARGKKNVPHIIAAWRAGAGKGYYSALLGKFLEDKLKKPLSTIIKTNVGSSIGSFNAASVSILGKDGKPLMSCAQLEEFYDTYWAVIMPESSHTNILSRVFHEVVDEVYSLEYSALDPKPLEDTSRFIFKELTLSRTSGDLLITAVDALTNNPYRMSNVSNPNMLVWEATRGSSAAPTKFPAYKPTSVTDNVLLVDGAFDAYDPALVGYQFALNNAQARSEIINPIVVSFGCKTPINPIPQFAGKVDVASIIDGLFDAQVNGTAMTMSHLLKVDETYFDFAAMLPKTIPMEEFYYYKPMMIAAAESQYERLEKFAESDPVQEILEAHD
jgi:hypothetical protein